jgi:hypothetical protein
MGTTTSNSDSREEANTTKNRSTSVSHKLPIFHIPTVEQLSASPELWNPAFNEFKLGDSIESVNSNLPTPYSSINWNTLPVADEYKHDIVKYIWPKLSDFGDQITKFIPPNTTINQSSYICFLFFEQKLFHISIRFFFDQTHSNYNGIVEAYAKAINTSVIQTKHGKEFYYEDKQIIYFACYHEDKSHMFIEVIRKDQTTSTDGYCLDRLSTRSPTHIKPFFPPQAGKFDIMISYCHKDKELCHRLYYRLLENKFRVWIDLENMYGPIVQRMAEAIENSHFVLICMSDAYKSSTYCRLEAEYAFKFQACLIPVVMKKDFTQTGWLGILCGLRRYIDFTKTTFDVAYEDLLTEIRNYQNEST